MIKFICEKQALYEAVNHVAKGISQRSTISALEGIRIRLDRDCLELTGYDLEFGVQTTIDVESEDTGEWILDARLLSESVRRFSGQTIVFEVSENNSVGMYCDATEFHISAQSAEEYPQLPNLAVPGGMSISQPLLKSMIAQTSYATSTNEAKPVFTGELFEIQDQQFHMVAIDGFRLAIRKEAVNCNESYRFVVPKRTLTEVANMMKEDSEKQCLITASRSHIVFTFDGYTVFSRLLEGDFYRYQSSIPAASETEVIVKTQDLTRCLERCSLLISGKYNAPIRCVFSGGSLNVTCSTGIGKINDTIPAQITGPDAVIGFNNKFLLEAARAADGDQIRIQLTGGNHVAKLVPMEGEHYIYLLMPIQLKQ